MNFLADEGIDRQIVALLREEGRDVVYVAEMDPGVPDERGLDRANQEERTLLSADKDFGELVLRQGLLALAVILVRLSGLPTKSKARIVASAVRNHPTEFSACTFAVVTPGAIRIRSSPR